VQQLGVIGLCMFECCLLLCVTDCVNDSFSIKHLDHLLGSHWCWVTNQGLHLIHDSLPFVMA
jgi:hypothetical protein